MRIGLLKDGKLAAQVDEVAGILLGLISSVKRRT
jgi:hypothetical protein